LNLITYQLMSRRGSGDSMGDAGSNPG